MKITAYECDTCHSITKDPPKFNIESWRDYFKVTEYRSYSSETAACGNDCARGAFEAWLVAQDKPEEPILEDEIAVSSSASPIEPKHISFNGIQPT
jgi:hypothetical protein